MLCSISGEAPQQPVASSKSGNVFEKRLIEAYISENHKDPVNGEQMEVADLIDLKSSRIVTPRPPTLTSIPSLLSTFQTEWDALALETFTIRQRLHQTRQELSTALYQHDAAVRVITRLTKERDEAREALSKVSISAAGVSNGEAMQVDNQGLPEELAAIVDETQESLSKSRRKRPLPSDWVDSKSIKDFVIDFSSEPILSDCSALACNDTGLAIVGASRGVASVYSISQRKVQYFIKVDAAITDVIWCEDEPVMSTILGTVRFGGNDIATTLQPHTGPVKALALHPSGKLLASVGTDKSFVFYDVGRKQIVTQINTDSELTTANFHPDGHLFAAGGMDGQIKFFHVKTGDSAGVYFQLDGPVQSVAFSENGILFAAVAKESSNVVIFDIRKEGKAAEASVLEIGGQVDCLRWDYSGQFLAASGPGGLSISNYTKSSKSWSDVISLAVPAVAMEWGARAKSLVVVNDKAAVSVLHSD